MCCLIKYLHCFCSFFAAKFTKFLNIITNDMLTYVNILNIWQIIISLFKLKFPKNRINKERQTREFASKFSYRKLFPYFVSDSEFSLVLSVTECMLFSSSVVSPSSVDTFTPTDAVFAPFPTSYFLSLSCLTLFTWNLVHFC